MGGDLNKAIDGELAVSYPSLPELSRRSRTDTVAVDGTGVGIAEQFIVHVFILDRLAEGV